MKLEDLKREDWIIGGVALVLVIGLLAFPWWEVSAGFGVYSVSVSEAATGDPDGWLGILALVATLLVLVDLAVQRFAPQTTLPEIGGSREMTRFVLAAIAALFVVLKFLFHIHFSLFGWGFYIVVILTAALVFFTYQARATASRTVSAGTA